MNSHTLILTFTLRLTVIAILTLIPSLGFTVTHILALMLIFRAGRPRSKVGNCLGRQAYWGGKLCQEKKREKEKGNAKKLRKVKKEKKERDKER